MAIYKNITSATTTTLIAKNSSRGGSVRKVLISNNHNTNFVTIELFLDDDSTTYTILKTIIPPLVTLTLNDETLSFNIKTYGLKITTSNDGTSTTISNEVSVIVK